jgi:hypothetical protein
MIKRITLISFLLSALMIPSIARIQKSDQTTNPYYLSKTGEAVLKDGKVIKGKFYYMHLP